MTSFIPEQPFNKLPDLPPPQELETKSILKQCIEARVALAELKQAGALLPNQSALINTIPILEAQASSAIENIVTTTDRLFQYAQSSEKNIDPATKEALRYGKALALGCQAIQHRPLTTNTAITICSAIKGIAMEVRKVPGTALLAGSQVIYTPPQGESLIRQKLQNWENFIHQATDIDILIRMAVMHYQFEAIHPFSDGNGRTGRILNLIFLIEQNLLDSPILYLSRHIIQQKDQYYQCLLNVTQKQDWENWLKFMLEAIRETSSWTTAKIQAICQLQNQTIDYVRTSHPKIYSRELIDVIFAQPYCRIANLKEAGIAQRQTASSYLKILCSLGILKEMTHGREKLFIHPRFLELLSAEEHTVIPYQT